MITGWIQSSDFSDRNLGNLDADQAIAQFQNHDWDSEFKQENKLKNQGNESCPAGIGFNADKGDLHICPEGGGINLVLFNYQIPKKIFGIIPTSSHLSKTRDGVPDKMCHQLIRLFFLGKYDALIQEMSRQ
jgi:hypothetical protein